MISKKAQNKQIGDLGEALAAHFLEKQGFAIIERNYWRKYGEIDIVARGTDGSIRFIEVKTVSHETKADLDREVTRGTWRPEEQVHAFKYHQISKAVETWLAEHAYEGNWQIDVVAVRVVPREKYAKVKYIENISF